MGRAIKAVESGENAENSLVPRVCARFKMWTARIKRARFEWVTEARFGSALRRERLTRWPPEAVRRASTPPKTRARHLARTWIERGSTGCARAPCTGLRSPAPGTSGGADPTRAFVLALPNEAVTGFFGLWGITHNVDRRRAYSGIRSENQASDSRRAYSGIRSENQASDSLRVHPRTWVQTNKNYGHATEHRPRPGEAQVDPVTAQLSAVPRAFDLPKPTVRFFWADRVFSVQMAF